jgi:hypothetical protein
MPADLSWVPKREVYIRRSLTTGAATFVLLALAVTAISTAIDLRLLLTLPIAGLMTLAFLVDDALRWRSQKYERWEIIEGHLHHTDQDGTASIPMDQIDDVFIRFRTRVILQTRSGERIMMRYLPFPNETAAQIRALLPGSVKAAPTE